MKPAWTLARATAALLAVSVGLVALLVAITLLASGRSFSQFGHIVIDLGAVVAVLLLVAIGLVYLPVAWGTHRLGLMSRPWAIAGGALTGCVAFSCRVVLLRDTGDPQTLSAYAVFLSQIPWELAGLVPFVMGGVVFALLAARPHDRSSHAARLDSFRNV